jgi:NADH dehydrogenase (ubiquinone) Fe-S protein 4
MSLGQTSVTIHQIAKNAMQSGVNNSKWKISFQADVTKYKYPLMSWTGSADMKQELELVFNSKQEAIRVSEDNGWTYKVIEPNKKKYIPKSYAANFS